MVARRGLGAALVALAVSPAVLARARPAAASTALDQMRDEEPRAADFRLDDRAVLEAFLDAALGDGDRRHLRFHPWIGPIRPVVLGDASAAQRLVLDGLLAWLHSASAQGSALAGAGPATLAVLFSDDPVEQLAGHHWFSAGAAFFATPNALREALGSARCSCVSLRGGAGTRGFILAHADVPIALVPCLSRMILALMGLRHPVAHALPSVLSRAHVAVEPTPLDRLLVAVATDPALSDGMAEAELRAVLPGVISRHRAWHGFDPLATSLSVSDAAGEGDLFSPSAARTLRAFSAVALPGREADGYLVRWRAGVEVAVHLRGRVPITVQAQLRWLLDWVAAATGLVLRAARHPREDGLVFLFAPTLERMWDEHGPTVASFFGNDRRRFEAAVTAPGVAPEGALTLLHHTVPGGALVRTLSMVATDGSPAATLRRLAREMLRALGLRGAGAAFGHSLLDAWSLAFQPTALDDRLLRVAYAETMQPGMPRRRAELEVARLLQTTSRPESRSEISLRSH